MYSTFYTDVIKGQLYPGIPAHLQIVDFPKTGESDCKTPDCCGPLNSRQSITMISSGHLVECMKNFKEQRNKKAVN